MVKPYDGDDSTFAVYKSGTQGPVFLCLHGAGHSGLSWALVASDVRIIQCFTNRGCGRVGYTKTTDDNMLSADQLVSDTDAVIRKLYEGQPMPKIIVVGHSLGGAIAIRFVSNTKLDNIAGLVVIDVVEGTALQSLSFMHTILQERPSRFRSTSHAIEWSVRSNYIRNVESARVSVPAQVVPAPKRADASGAQESATNTSAKDDAVIWRTDLFKSEQYWKGWFTGMSHLFLTAPVAKELILAGTDRLDKELTIAQMQGKFQLVLMYGCGHAVHEDVPEKVSGALMDFIQHHRL